MVATRDALSSERVPVDIVYPDAEQRVSWLQISVDSSWHKTAPSIAEINWLI